MTYYCEVCGNLIEPNAAGRIRLEGITHESAPKAWVWCPVPVHEACRLLLKTPDDDRIGKGYVALSDSLRA